MSEGENRRIVAFLEEPVPPTRTPSWETWKIVCAGLGDEAPTVFINTLRYGAEELHYAAVLGLRVYGYEAWAVGYGKEMTFKFRLNQRSEWVTISPKNPPVE